MATMLLRDHVTAVSGSGILPTGHVSAYSLGIRFVMRYELHAANQLEIIGVDFNVINVINVINGVDFNGIDRIY